MLLLLPLIVSRMRNSNLRAAIEGKQDPEERVSEPLRSAAAARFYSL